MSKYRQCKGQAGEELFCVWLKQRSYKIIARNWRPKKYLPELDIVAQKDGQIYIFEVKNHSFKGTGFESILSDNQLIRLKKAQAYLGGAKVKLELVLVEQVGFRIVAL